MEKPVRTFPVSSWKYPSFGIAIAWGLLQFFSSCAKVFSFCVSIADSDFSEISRVVQMCRVLARSIFFCPEGFLS